MADVANAAATDKLEGLQAVKIEIKTGELFLTLAPLFPFTTNISSFLFPYYSYPYILYRKETYLYKSSCKLKPFAKQTEKCSF